MTWLHPSRVPGARAQLLAICETLPRDLYSQLELCDLYNALALPESRPIRPSYFPLVTSEMPACYARMRNGELVKLIVVRNHDKWAGRTDSRVRNYWLNGRTLKGVWHLIRHGLYENPKRVSPHTGRDETMSIVRHKAEREADRRRAK